MKVLVIVLAVALLIGALIGVITFGIETRYEYHSIEGRPCYFQETEDGRVMLVVIDENMVA